MVCCYSYATAATRMGKERKRGRRTYSCCYGMGEKEEEWKKGQWRGEDPAEEDGSLLVCTFYGGSGMGCRCAGSMAMGFCGRREQVTRWRRLLQQQIMAHACGMEQGLVGGMELQVAGSGAAWSCCSGHVRVGNGGCVSAATALNLWRGRVDW